MPRQLVDCLGQVTTTEDADKCVNAVAGKGSDPRRPSHEDCAAAVAHVKELAPDVEEAQASHMIEACEKNGTRGEVECIDKATTIEEVNACEPQSS
jgi:hypothetical protein